MSSVNGSLLQSRNSSELIWAEIAEGCIFLGLFESTDMWHSFRGCV